mgnify:FL=1
MHELHIRRLSRNIWLSIILIGFVLIIFCLTIVKVSNGNGLEAYDHVVRPSLLPEVKN